jgi:hypothetical protein
MAIYAVDKLISETRRLAAEYRRTTGKTLPVSGEIAVHDAIRLLELEPASDPAASYDALRQVGSAQRRLQIKGRVIFTGNEAGYRLGQLKLDKEDWDAVALVLMDENYEPEEIFVASRGDIEDCLADSRGSRRSRRGAMSITRFKIIGERLWSRENGLETEAYWTNTSP